MSSTVIRSALTAEPRSENQSYPGQDEGPARTDRDRVQGVLKMMESFAQVLRAYFTVEELEDHVELLALAPHLEGRIQMAQTEHRMLRARLEQFVCTARITLGQRPAAEAVQSLCAWFDAFEEELQEHERGERRLLNDAYCDDLGSGD